VNLSRLTLGSSLLFGCLSLLSACVVRTTEHDSRGYNQGYREGYYDRERHRWWHEHEWRECVEHDEHCHD
jgi:hypothetical protein